VQHLHVLIILKSGSLSLLEQSGPVQACNGIALSFTSYVNCILVLVGGQSMDKILAQFRRKLTRFEFKTPLTCSQDVDQYNTATQSNRRDDISGFTKFVAVFPPLTSVKENYQRIR
jgi:hypothetical protein